MPSKAALLALLFTAAAPASAEVIKLVCTLPGSSEESRIILDTSQGAVLQDGKAGVVAAVSAEAIHYFVRFRGRIQANRYNPTDGSLSQAIARPAPETGYDRRQLACRRE